MTEQRKCLKVGITGGIGSGKTTVCKMFEALGVPVYYADDEAKQLMVNDLHLKAKIIAEFGEAAYLTDGSLNRRHLAEIIFHDAGKRLVLNGLVHPVVLDHGRNWHEAQCLAGAEFTLKEAALLIESGSYKDLDVLILVSAPMQVRIKRVMARDGVTAQSIKQRIRSQLSERERLKFAHFSIKNDGKTALVPQVWQLYQRLVRHTSEAKAYL
jgi:dephospho-CoA kinase